MKRITLCLFIGILYLSCKKEDVIVINPSIKATSIKIDQVINDSTIVLTWNKFTGSNFKQYRLVRSAVYMKNDKFGTFVDTVHSSTDVNQTSYKENSMPLARDITYSLYIEKDTAERFPIPAYVSYRRPNSLIYGFPTDVLINKSTRKLYITEQQKIQLVDYSTGRVVNSKEFPLDIGFCSLGSYNGNDELYVPLNDGWLEILDAATLERKDRIYVAGFGIGSVVAASGKLYVSSSDRSFYGYSNCLKVYDRATKTLLTRTGYWDQTRLMLLEGTNVEMIDISINLAPGDVSYFQFSPDGALLSSKQDPYHGDFLINYNIIRSFPDGNRFITSASGTVFNKSLVFDRYLKQYGTYSDFAFNSDGSIVYAANATEKKIDIITYPATTNSGNYPTKYSPYKIFRDGNSLISVSNIGTFQYNGYIVIENIKI